MMQRASKNRASLPLPHVLAGVAVGLVGLVLGSAQANGAGGRSVGWSPHAFSPKVLGARLDELPITLYPEKENETEWTERVSIFVLEDERDPSGALEALESNDKLGCAEYSVHRVPLKPEQVAKLGLQIWHCPRNTEGDGMVGVRKVVVADGKVAVMSIEGKYPPFKRDASPLREEQLDRWGSLQGPFNWCDDWATAVGCGPDIETLMTASAVTLGSDEVQALERIEERGRAIFALDQIAWRGTDFAVAQKTVDPKNGSGSDTFIAVQELNSAGTLYFTKGDGKSTKLRGVVRVDDEAHWSVIKGAKRLPADVQPRFDALQVALKSNLKVCSKTVNHVVLPSEEHDGWWVYVMSASEREGLMPLGGHTRFAVDSNGRILSKFEATRGCLTHDLNQKPQLDARNVTPMSTHVVSATPTEFHVFQTMTHDTPLLVITANAAWRIDGGRISRLAVE